VLGTLGRISDLEHEDLDEVLRTIVESAARTLKVPRVNVWLYDQERTRITCIQEYCEGSSARQIGSVLEAKNYPHYFEALESLRNVTAIDAEGDIRTSELLVDYLRPNGIGSMLDVPILRSGQVIGVVCHEHVGGARPFGAWERAFAGSIGDLVALALETQRRLEAEHERSRLIERLARLRGVESLGFLAAGVAHDFRNLLMVVSASAEALHTDAGRGGDQAYADVQIAVKRAKDLCDLLLTYSGRTPASKQTVSLVEVASELARLLRVRLPDQSSLTLEAEANLPAVEGDATALRQVVLNLIVNAFDALRPSGGCVKLRLTQTPPPVDIDFDFRRGAPTFVLFEVEDDGIGMAPETRARMFEPFFTTKPDGHGFGLASVLGIVRSHEGALEVDSMLGRGTIVRVWIPVAPSAPP
jgi:two-component system, cell cycle sensor histidine kinase and response regulator CckA